MQEFNPSRKYQQPPKSEVRKKYPVERLVLRGLALGSKILKKSQETEQPLTPLGDLEKYKRRREERRWRDGV
jgi:hypothetical protein